MADTPGADEPLAGRWLPFAGAAQALGVSERTLRRYVAAGSFASRRIHHRIQVFVPDEEVAGRALLAPRPDSLRSALQSAVAALERELAAEREHADRLAARIAAVEEECRALAAHIEAVAPSAAPAPEGQPILIPGDLEREEPRQENSARPNPRGVRHDHPSLL